MSIIEKYRKITGKFLMIIILIIPIFFIDLWILPLVKVNDTIVSYSKTIIIHRNKFSATASRHHVSYNYLTQKGLKFSTEKLIKDMELTIEYSCIFKNITSVKSKTQDYSNKLISDLNGVSFYIIIGLFISTIISFLFLRFKDNLSENGFYNIIFFNSLLLFYLLYILSLFNN